MLSGKEFLLVLLSLSVILGGCSSSRYRQAHDSAPDHDIDVSRIPDAVPRREPRSRHGNPPSYTVNGRRYTVMQKADGYVERGIASWYGKKFHGHRTSSGEPFNMYAMTAAHTRLPLPTYVRVTNLKNGRSIVVRVNDRGPFHANRIIDLSYAAAKKLGITAKGTGLVEIRAINPDAKATPVANYNRPRGSTASGGEVQLYLQVGAFVSRRNAEQLRSRLRRQFASLNINAGYNPQRQIYRVRIGPLSSVAEADRLADSLSRRGYKDSHVVIE